MLRKHKGDSARTASSTSPTLFESLESRQMLSVSLTSGVLTVTGTSNADVIEFQKRADEGKLKVTVNGTENKFALSTVAKIVAFGGDGADFIEYSRRDGGLSLPAFIDAGNGPDTVQTGAGNDTILGANGRDWIQSKAGNDSVSGGAFMDHIEGGDGNDTLRGDDGDDDIWGDAGDDSILGGNGADDVRGGTGHDSIFGNGGNDDFVDTVNDTSGEIRDRTTDDNGANTNL